MATTISAATTLGTLVVVVIRARNLRDKHTFTKQDPFVTVQLGKEKKSTEIDKRGGQHPVWDVDLQIPVSTSTSKDARTLKVLCFSKEPREDDLVGAGEVDITEVLETGEFDDWVTIKEDDAYRGEVYLEMTFFNASNTKPHSRRKPQMQQSERLQYHGPSPTPPASNTLPAAAPSNNGNIPSNSNRPQASPPRRPDALPPPPNLQPGYGANGAPPPHRTAPQNNQVPPTPTTNKPQAIPSILRPGNVKASPIPIPEPPRPVVAHPEPPLSFNFPVPEQQAPLPYPGDAEYPSSNANAPSPSFPSFPVGPSNYPQRSSQIDGPSNPSAPPPSFPSFSGPSPYPPRSNQFDGGNSYGGTDYGNEYAARERAALARASQEEADEELARVMSQNEGGGGGGRASASQEQADEELARLMAQNEGIDLDGLRREEADREVARKLARELNAEVLSQERAKHDGRKGAMPGGW